MRDGWDTGYVLGKVGGQTLGITSSKAIDGRLGKTRRTSEEPGLEVQGPEIAWVEGGETTGPLATD